jgi:hypothetical protein
VQLQKGSLGQFDVVADGEVVATRKQGFLQKLLGSGWPEPAAVIAALRRRLGNER